MNLRSGKELRYRHPRLQPSVSSSDPLVVRHSKKKLQSDNMRLATDIDVSTSPSASTTIQVLPPEVLREVFTWAKCEDNIPAHIRSASNTESLEVADDVDPNSLNLNEEHPSYKSFRLVCRVWHGVATPLLFHTMMLLPHIDSWNKLGHVCTTPQLAQYIRTIQVVMVERLFPGYKGLFNVKYI